MRVLIADDHELLRDVLSSYLENEGDFEIETAADLKRALELIGRSNEAPFDLVILDYGMDGMDGYRGLERAIEASAGRPIALMSGLAPPDVAERVLAIGAAGFLPKTLPARSLVNAVRFMIAGEIYIPHELHLQSRHTSTASSDLSLRERQVLSGLCKGQTNKEIARQLELREPTIKLHVKTICRKLGARNRTHAAMIARERGVF